MPRPARPFYRQKLTIIPPGDETSDLTLDVVILLEQVGPDVLASDLPELQEAGWSAHTVKGAEVFVRIVG